MIYQNEIDPKCQAVLRRHFPDDVIDGRSIVDVRPDDLRDYQQCHFFAGIGGFSLGFARAGVPAGLNIWTGGFPCQDLSVAGKRKGMAGERSGLWFEFARLVRSIRPRWIVVENVRGLLSSNHGADFGVVLSDLASCGYDAEWQTVSPSCIGAPQSRYRVFIVANNAGARFLWGEWGEREVDTPFWGEIRDANFQWGQFVPRILRECNGVPGRVDRIRQLGNAVVPQIAELIGRRIMTVEGLRRE